MEATSMDYAAPNTQFTYDLRNNVFFKKDDHNFILSLSVKQLNTLGNSSLLDIYLDKDNYVEPHYHQNASELVYCIAGSAVVSLINPFTNELLHFPIGPGQVANVPQGWWHYEVATQDNTHLLAIFDAPVPEAIFGSDILRLTPASVLAANYCLNEDMVKETLAPIESTVVIGPPAGCQSSNGPAAILDGQQQGASLMPGQTQQSHGSYAYPLRPIESAYSPYPPPFHPVPFLYRYWD
ncbi:cupin domain-containing protein [Paenibacillus agaridevorans]|uniref:cupin domain-containing protein n=1 Tax=Paenibacillus agaridevorans TaxID=171404 RepID=UPI001BE43EAC|nr:cupin domain-containing protein [Paenibacillus agaridevorans]